MRKYVFDTNVLLLKMRSHELWEIVKQKYEPFDGVALNFVSVVTVGELQALAKRNYWGEKRLKTLDDLLKKFMVVDIKVNSLIHCYAEIDAFSQGKLKERPLNQAARNMGKNDLWIAATATVLNATLLTMDKDFEHLHSEFCSVAVIT